MVPTIRPERIAFASTCSLPQSPGKCCPGCPPTMLASETWGNKTASQARRPIIVLRQELQSSCIIIFQDQPWHHNKHMENANVKRRILPAVIHSRNIGQKNFILLNVMGNHSAYYVIHHSLQTASKS